MYMSYCRYEGTLNELRACLDDVQGHIDGAAEYEVSDHETRQFAQMVKEFVWFLQDAELIDDHGELDNDKLEEICELMRSKADSANNS